jgi:hypothetical protein
MTNDNDNENESNGNSNDSSISSDTVWHKCVSKLLTDGTIYIKLHITDK